MDELGESRWACGAKAGFCPINFATRAYAWGYPIEFQLPWSAGGSSARCAIPQTQVIGCATVRNDVSRCDVVQSVQTGIARERR